VKLEWSQAALADLDRFADFLHDHHPYLARIIGSEILKRASIISEFPELGRPIDGRNDYRELILPVRNATYVFRYRYYRERLVMMRVFHSREDRQA
jgi:plasmid stabilization system protein ParE